MKHFIIQNKIDRWRKICIILFWLLLWQIVSFFIPKILFASPIEVGRSLYHLVGEGDFWKAIFYSFMKVGIGFFWAVFLGSLLGFLALPLGAAQFWSTPAGSTT